MNPYYRLYRIFVIIVAIAITTSTMLSTISNIVFVIIVYMLGHMTERIAHIASRVDSLPLKNAAAAFIKILPDFQKFEFKDALSLGTGIDVSMLVASLSYALLYSSILLIVGMVIFRRREVDRL